MIKTMSKRYKITLSIFVIVTITAGLFGYLLDQVLTDQPEGSSLGMGLWLVLPFLTGIVLGIINKDLKQIGVKPNFKHNLKWYAVSIFVFPFVTLINIIVAKMTGGLTVGEIELSALFVLMISSFSGSFVKNIFEEFAWRGSLYTYLEKTGMNDWLLYFFNGNFEGKNVKNLKLKTSIKKMKASLFRKGVRDSELTDECVSFLSNTEHLNERSGFFARVFFSDDVYFAWVKNEAHPIKSLGEYLADKKGGRV